MKVEDITRKAKYGVFIPRKITRKPKYSGSVISDLFILRTSEGWRTYFELLNIPGLLNGSYSATPRHKILFVFFDQFGHEVGRKHINAPVNARQTLEMSAGFFPKIGKASTFAVFHTDFELDDDLAGSFLAERGYSGYQRENLPIRGYVHGNLDSISLHKNRIQMLGNAGILPRFYQVQHPFTGEAKYELFITNPCNQKIRIRVQVRTPNSHWEKYLTFTLEPRGSQKFTLNLLEKDIKFVRILSRFYLGRPVIFRGNEQTLDVFHG